MRTPRQIALLERFRELMASLDSASGKEKRQIELELGLVLSELIELAMLEREPKE